MINVLIGDCREVLKTLPDKSVHCCVTSPPYYRLRRYCTPGTPEADKEIGQEQTPEEYISNLVDIFKEVKRVLRDDATLFINIKDCYDKNHELRGIPWKLAFALKDDGWRLIQEIIWEKPNCMPESVTKRCTCSHESIFLLAKSKTYFFDHVAIKEPAKYPNDFTRGQRKCSRRDEGYNTVNGVTTETRNKRSVWHVNTVAYKETHFAAFPPKLITSCILAGTSEYGVCSVCGSPYKRIIEKVGHTEHGGYRKRADAPGAEVSESSVFRTGLITTTQTVGWKPSCSCDAPLIPATVLDPFGGSGTVGQWCTQNNRNAILIELNPEYKPLIEERINSKPKNHHKKIKVSPLEKCTLQQNLIQYFS